MKAIFAALTALLLVCAPALARPPAPPAQARAIDAVRLEAYVDGLVQQAMADDHIAGVTVAVVDKNGPLLTKAYGIAAPGKKADADTLFRVGSISKTGIWIALMQLVEQGKIKLDDPINAHLPKALQIPDEGFKQPILIRHLMTHSAGFEDSALGHLFVKDPNKLLPLTAYLQSHRVHRVREAGTVAVYSNYGAALAGAIVEHETGQQWQDYAEQHILRPIGVTSATYREPYSQKLVAAGLPAPLPADVAARVSDGFVFKNAGFEPQSWEYVEQMGPVGALSASANDMARYMRALLDPSLLQQAGVLQQQTALAMREPMFANTPGVGSWRHGFMDFPAPAGQIVFGHDGDLMFQHSAMEIFPNLGIAIFAAVNTPGGASFEREFPGQVTKEFFGAPAHPARVALSQADLAKYAGVYINLRSPYFRTERALYPTVSALPIAALPNGDLRFGQHRYYPVGDGVFERDDDVDHIVFRAVDGRMRLYDGESTAPADRVGLFDSPGWLQIVFGITMLVSLWGVVSGLRRIVMRTETMAALTVDGLCVIWLVAFALLGFATGPWLADQAAAVYQYPGRLLPIACWLFAAGVVATAAATVALLTVARPKDWSWLRWLRAGAALAVFLVASVTLWHFGFLGYSGW